MQRILWSLAPLLFLSPLLVIAGVALFFVGPLGREAAGAVVAIGVVGTLAMRIVQRRFVQLVSDVIAEREAAAVAASGLTPEQVRDVTGWIEPHGSSLPTAPRAAAISEDLDLPLAAVQRALAAYDEDVADPSGPIS